MKNDTGALVSKSVFCQQINPILQISLSFYYYVSIISYHGYNVCLKIERFSQNGDFDVVNTYDGTDVGYTFLPQKQTSARWVVVYNLRVYTVSLRMLHDPFRTHIKAR